MCNIQIINFIIETKESCQMRIGRPIVVHQYFIFLLNKQHLEINISSKNMKLLFLLLNAAYVK